MALLSFLQRSRVSDAFRAALLRFSVDGRPCDEIAFPSSCPPVKVERTLTKLLAEHPDLPVDHVSIEGRSGCEYFRGTLRVVAAGAERRIHFHWDCKWKAQELGWTDYFGFADQARAAMEFGYDCFRSWEEEPVLEGSALEESVA